MARDDMVPDEALVARLDTLAVSLENVYEIARLRSHLPHSELSKVVGALYGLVGEMNAAAQPDDPINAKYRSRMREEGFMTYSGVMFYPFDPKPEEVRHTDIVQGLVNECRYNGQVPRHLSVAEHSIKVAAITEHLLTQEAATGNVPEDIVPLACLYALLHDAHEAYTGDLVAPVKPSITNIYGTPWEQVEAQIQEAIYSAYDLPPLPAEAEFAIKQADVWMRYCECIVLHPKRAEHFKAPPHDVDQIGRVKRVAPAVQQVTDLFDSEIRRLVSFVGGTIPLGKPLPGPVEEDPAKPGNDEAVQRLAEAIGNPIPGERPNDPQPPTQQEQFLPSFERDPRPEDVQPGAWQNAINSTQIQVPSELMNEPEFRRPGEASE